MSVIDSAVDTSFSTKSYDYIIVGSGSAGGLLAYRLTEQNPDRTVLLLEAGLSDKIDPNIYCPGAYGFLQLTAIDWQFKTEPQTHQNNRISFCPRGKVLGGSSSINAMFYVRGDPNNFNDWAYKYGCEGWDYFNLLPLFKKTENLNVSGEELKGINQQFHGKGGPISTERPKGGYNVWSERLVKASVEAGIKSNPDFNGPSQEGVGLGLSTIENGLRCNSVKNTLSEASLAARKNLTVAHSVFVTKVVFDRNNQAIGVSCRLGGDNKSADVVIRCNKEVVLSAGAICSPWILQNSGVGPASLLRQLNIPVVYDNPFVGEGLEDHLFTPVAFPVKELGTTLCSIATIPEKLQQATTQFTTSLTGPLASSLLQSSAFYRSGLNNNLLANDTQLHFVACGMIPPLPTGCNIVDAPIVLKNAGKDAVMMMPTLLQPRSKGYVRIRSSDPTVYPQLQPNYLSDKVDLKVLVEGHKKCRQIAKQPSIAHLLEAEVTDDTIPFSPDTDAYLEEFARRYALTVYHPTSTCKMGTVNSVCDSRLRVKGVKGLRVVDASVMPTVTSGNTNAPTFVISEKAAVMIDEDSKVKPAVAAPLYYFPAPAPVYYPPFPQPQPQQPQQQQQQQQQQDFAKQQPQPWMQYQYPSAVPFYPPAPLVQAPAQAVQGAQPAQAPRTFFLPPQQQQQQQQYAGYPPINPYPVFYNNNAVGNNNNNNNSNNNIVRK